MQKLEKTKNMNQINFPVVRTLTKREKKGSNKVSFNENEAKVIMTAKSRGQSDSHVRSNA